MSIPGMRQSSLVLKEHQVDAKEPDRSIEYVDQSLGAIHALILLFSYVPDKDVIVYSHEYLQENFKEIGLRSRCYQVVLAQMSVIVKSDEDSNDEKVVLSVASIVEIPYEGYI